jgi:hypothetical protein
MEEIGAMGYCSGYTVVKGFVLSIKRDSAVHAEMRLETGAWRAGSGRPDRPGVAKHRR